MAHWKYTLKIKQFFVQDTPIPIEELTGRTREVVKHLRYLSRRLRESNFFLSEELAECDPTEGDRPFYNIVGNLYDLADGHSIWIE